MKYETKPYNYDTLTVTEQINQLKLTLPRDINECTILFIRELDTSLSDSTAAFNLYLQQKDSNGPVFIGGTGSFYNYKTKRYMRANAVIANYDSPIADDDGDIHYGNVSWNNSICTLKEGYNDNIYTYTITRTNYGETAYPDNLIDTVLLESVGGPFTVGSKLEVFYR